MYSLQELKETFDFLKKSTVDNIKGCYCFDSGKKGSCIGISILTHGNEPSGLAAFKYFFDNKIIPKTGKIIFVANNIKAAEKFFKAKTDRDKDKCRFVKINFNRLPKDCLKKENNDYEITRVQELYPIYKKFDFGLDIHSTRTDPTPSIVNISDDLRHGLFAGFPRKMKTIIANMANVQTGIPACKLFGGINRKIPILGIETGIHVDGASFRTAIKCAEIFCFNCGALPKKQIKIPKSKYQVYKVVASVFFPKKQLLPLKVSRHLKRFLPKRY